MPKRKGVSTHRDETLNSRALARTPFTACARGGDLRSHSYVTINFARRFFLRAPALPREGQFNRGPTISDAARARASSLAREGHCTSAYLSPRDLTTNYPEINVKAGTFGCGIFWIFGAFLRGRVWLAGDCEECALLCWHFR